MLVPAATLMAIAVLLPYGPGDLSADTVPFMHPDNRSILGAGPEVHAAHATHLITTVVRCTSAGVRSRALSRSHP